jgi:flagellar biogenesis protein FliO
VRPSSPNAKYAITFGLLSLAILLLPVFWSPLNNQPITPFASGTPRTVAETLYPEQTLKPNFQGPLQPAPVAEPPVRESETIAPPLRRDPSFEFANYLRRTVLSLLGVTILIGLSLKLMQRYLPGLAAAPRKKPWMNVLAREAIGPNQSLALVRVGTRVLLVGLCEQNMTTLCELNESEVAEMLEPPPAAAPSEPGSGDQPRNLYGDVLRHYLSIVPGMGTKK